LEVFDESDKETQNNLEIEVESMEEELSILNTLQSLKSDEKKRY
jgi:hypothetical protein